MSKRRALRWLAICADLDVIYLALPERNEIVLVENMELEP